MKHRPRTFAIDLRHICLLLEAGWVWCATGHDLRSPSGRKRWHVRTVAAGSYQLEPPFDATLLALPESNR